MTDSDDRVRLAQTVARHQNMIQAYAYAIVRDFHTAEDVYQDVATVVAERWDSAPSGEALTPWLREITRRKALEALRKLQRMRPMLSENVIAKIEEHFLSAEAGPGRKDLRAVLVECVHKLERVARQVIQARYCDQLPCEQIATQIGRSVQSVYSIIKRSRLMLAKCAERSSAEMERG